MSKNYKSPLPQEENPDIQEIEKIDAARTGSDQDSEDELEVDEGREERIKNYTNFFQELFRKEKENQAIENEIAKAISEAYQLTEEDYSFLVRNFETKEGLAEFFHKIYTFKRKSDEKEISFDVEKISPLRKVGERTLNRIFASKILEELRYGPKKNAMIVDSDLFIIAEDVVSKTSGGKFETIEQMAKNNESLKIKEPKSLYHFVVLDIIKDLLQLNVNPIKLGILTTKSSDLAAASHEAQSDSLKPMISNFDTKHFPSNNMDEVVQEIFGKQSKREMLGLIKYALDQRKLEIAEEVFNKLSDGKKDQAGNLQKPSFLKAVENAYIYTAKLEKEILEKKQSQESSAGQSLEEKTLTTNSLVKQYKEEIENRFEIFSKELNKIITQSQVSPAKQSQGNISQTNIQAAEERPAASISVKEHARKVEDHSAASKKH